MTEREAAELVRRARELMPPTVSVMGRAGWWATGCVGFTVGWIQAWNGFFWMPHIVYGGDGDG